MGTKKDALQELQSLKNELALKCKAKEEQISGQADYIAEHITQIAIKSILGDRLKKGKEKRTEIIELLVAEGIDTVATIQNDPHDIKDKLLNALKKSASRVLNLLFK